VIIRYINKALGIKAVSQAEDLFVEIRGNYES